MKRTLTATIKYLANHVINHILSYTMCHAWDRNVLGWLSEPKASIFLGQYVQMAGVRTGGQGKLYA